MQETTRTTPNKKPKIPHFSRKKIHVTYNMQKANIEIGLSNSNFLKYMKMLVPVLQEMNTTLCQDDNTPLFTLKNELLDEVDRRRKQHTSLIATTEIIDCNSLQARPFAKLRIDLMDSFTMTGYDGYKTVTLRILKEMDKDYTAMTCINNKFDATKHYDFCMNLIEFIFDVVCNKVHITLSTESSTEEISEDVSTQQQDIATSDDTTEDNEFDEISAIYDDRLEVDLHPEIQKLHTKLEELTTRRVQQAVCPSAVTLLQETHWVVFAIVCCMAIVVGYFLGSMGSRAHSG